MNTDIDVLEKAATHAAEMLLALGIDGDDQTGMRLVRALDELTAGRHVDPTRHLAVQFDPPGGEPALVIVTDIPFTSVCEHHVLPFTGIATVAYLPTRGAPIPGLSKLARMVRDYAARPQLQEQLTNQVADALHDTLGARGAACAIRGVHTCMALRGACTGTGAAMVTVQYVGEVAQDPWRQEFAAQLHTAAWR